MEKKIVKFHSEQGNYNVDASNVTFEVTVKVWRESEFVLEAMIFSPEKVEKMLKHMVVVECDSLKRGGTSDWMLV